MRVLEQSARDAGLAVDEVGLDKLMEQGKLTTEKVLPHFAKNLREIAKNNDALAKALRENFQPALGRASNTLRDLANEVFQGGLKDGLMFVLNGFSEIGKESKGLARTIGAVLGGAVMGVLFPFKLFFAILYDISNFIREKLGIDKFNLDIIKLTSSVIGLAVGFTLLLKTLRLIAGAMGAIKAAKTFLSGEESEDKDKGKKKSKGIKAASKVSLIGGAALLSAPAAAAAATGFGLHKAGQAFGSTSFAQESGAQMMADIRSRASRFQDSRSMQRVQVDINMNQNAGELIEAKVNDGLQKQYNDVYDTVGSSKD